MRASRLSASMIITSRSGGCCRGRGRCSSRSCMIRLLSVGCSSPCITCEGGSVGNLNNISNK